MGEGEAGLSWADLIYKLDCILQQGPGLLNGSCCCVSSIKHFVQAVCIHLTGNFGTDVH